MSHPLLRHSAWIQSISDRLYRRSQYVVLNPWCERIGHLALEIHIAAALAVRDRKKLVLIPHFRVVNRAIFRLRFDCDVGSKDLRYLLVAGLLWLCGLANYGYRGIHGHIKRRLPGLIDFLHLPELMYYPRVGLEPGPWAECKIIGTENYHSFTLLNQYPRLAHLTNSQTKRAADIRRHMGISADARIVCVHVRESGYLGSDPVHDFRDADILKYIDAIRWLIAQGFVVIRLGDVSMKPLPALDGLIDYALTEYKSALMDLYFVSACECYIGCDSGLFMAARMFDRPICFLNTAELNCNFIFRDTEVHVPKHIYSIPNERLLSFREILTSDLGLDEYPPTRYRFVELDSQEILTAVQEFVEVVDSRDFTGWLPGIQEEIRKMILDKFTSYVERPDIPDNKRHDHWGSQLVFHGWHGRTFLENCWEYGDYLRNRSEGIRSLVRHQHVEKALISNQ